jgi:hypothetical protein
VAVGIDHSRPLKALDLDQAPRHVRVLGHEARQPRRRGQLVQQTPREPPMQRADDGLVLADRLAIGAVAQPENDSSHLCWLALGSEAQRGKGPAHRLLGPRSASAGLKFPTQPPPGTFHLPQPSRARRNAASQPAREPGVGIPRLAAGKSVGRNRPAVPRTPKRLRQALARDQPGSVQALEMDAHATGMKPQLRCQLIGPRRTAEGRQMREQARTRRLGQHVTRTV